MKVLFIFVGLLGLGAVIGAIVIGGQSFEGIVTEHPYERGLRYDARRKQRERLGWRIEAVDDSLHTGPNELHFRVLDRRGRAVPNLNATLSVSRPATDRYNRTYPVRAAAEEYRTQPDFPLFGNWDLVFQLQRDSEAVALTRRVFVKKIAGPGVQP